MGEFRERMPTEGELMTVIRRICADMGVPYPRITFEPTASALCKAEEGEIILTARDWAIEHMLVTHNPSCYLEGAIHEAAHWVLYQKGHKDWTHSTRFYRFLFAALDGYGPEDDDAREAFVLRAYVDENAYVPRYANAGWRAYWGHRDRKKLVGEFAK